MPKNDEPPNKTMRPSKVARTSPTQPKFTNRSAKYFKRKIKNDQRVNRSPRPHISMGEAAIARAGFLAEIEERHRKQIPNQHLGQCDVVCDHGQPRILVSVAKRKQKCLLLQTHEGLLHQDHSKVCRYKKTPRALCHWPGMEAMAKKNHN